MPQNPNPVDQAEWVKSQEDRRRADQLEKLRADSAAKTEESIARLRSHVSQRGQNFEQSLADVSRLIEQGKGQLGVESAATLIRQMGPSIEALSNMQRDLAFFLFSAVGLKIIENLNYRDFTPLAMTAEAARNLRIFFDEHLNTEGAFSDELKALCVPYLADVDDDGVLNVNLDVPNTELTEVGRQAFVDKYKVDFNESIERWINEYEDPARAFGAAANPMYRVDTLPDGKRKIRDMRAAGPDPVYLSKEEFRNFRTHALQPLLEEHFQAEFRPESPSNMRP